MRVAILYDGGSEDWSPQDVAAVMANVKAVRDVLRGAGHEVELVAVRLNDLRWLSRVKRNELVFNLCEGINGHARYEDWVLGALELTGVPFTGCRHWPITICHRKYHANALLSAASVPVPEFVLAERGQIPSEFPLPAIIKPNGEDASVGIDMGAVCTTRKTVRQRVGMLLENFDEVLIQRYIAGREFNVGFVGNQALPISEIDFDAMPAGSWPIVTYAAKWVEGSPDDAGTQPVCPARIPADLARRIVAVARKAWEFMSRGEGYGRVDLRLDEQNQPWVLEVNPDPDLSRDAGLARMGRAHGWSYEELVLQIVHESLARRRPVPTPDPNQPVPA